MDKKQENNIESDRQMSEFNSKIDSTAKCQSFMFKIKFPTRKKGKFTEQYFGDFIFGT